jgi:hypothetical protein
MRRVVLVVVAACQPAPAPTLSNKVPAPEVVLAITESAVGPIDRDAKATLASLRRLLVGYEVRPVNDGSLQYDVYAGSERLLFVVPDDDGSVFNVHAVSERVGVNGRDWRVGRAFRDANRLTECECWGPNPTCWKSGEHVAVNFARECDDVRGKRRRGDDGFRVLDGHRIQRVIWSPRGFGDNDQDDGL